MPPILDLMTLAGVFLILLIYVFEILRERAELDAMEAKAFDDGFYAGSNEEAQRWFDIQDDYDALEKRLHQAQLEKLQLRAELARRQEIMDLSEDDHR